MSGDRGSWRLVARRDFWVRLRDKGFLISTAITITVLSGFILIRAYGAGGPPSYDIGLVNTPERTGVLIGVTGARLGAQIRVHVVDDRAAGESAIRDGRLDAVVVDSASLIARTDPPPATVKLAVELALVGQGVEPIEVDALEPGDPNRQANQTVALVAALLLYGQLFGYGIWVASGVIEEKSSRVVEVLLAAIRPRQLLAGKIFGIGLLGLLQLAVISGAGIALATLTGVISIPLHAVGTLAVALLWFVFGFSFYASLFAVAGALVSRMEELQNAIVPINLTILGSFFISINSVNSPDTVLAKVASLLPFSSALAMPVRIAVGSASGWEALLSLAILTGSIAGLIPLAGRLYSGAVLRIGARVKLLDAWRASVP